MANDMFESVESIVEEQLDVAAKELEEHYHADLISIYGPISTGLDAHVRDTIESRTSRCGRLCVVLQTHGGVVELAERIVDVLRHHYEEILFIVPDRAMSAGTVLVMSGDEIWMDYFSCLGPIDPQLLREDGRLVPALGYLSQFQRLIDKSRRGELTPAEFALLQRLDLAELHQFEEARELSHELLVSWLKKYKFKNWNVTEESQRPVTAEMREKRAREIAEALSDNERWHSHGRAISMGRLTGELNLRVSDFGADEQLRRKIRRYHRLMLDYMRVQRFGGFVHMRRGRES